MLAPCKSPHQKICGFSEVGGPLNGKVVFEKRIDIIGQSILVRMTLTHASASQNYVENLTTLNEAQKYLTFQSEQNYFESIKDADVIFYNGHSRHGGGPDFTPVVLNAAGTADYEGHYKVLRTGIRRVLGEVRKRKDNNFILGLFSCYSASYYQEALFQAKPGIKTIFTVGSINYFDTIFSSMGYLEGLLHGSCGEDLTHLARQTDSVRHGILDFNMGSKAPEKMILKPIPENIRIMD